MDRTGWEKVDINTDKGKKAWLDAYPSQRHIVDGETYISPLLAEDVARYARVRYVVPNGVFA